MENFDGTIGRITTTVLSVGMSPNTKLQLIVSIPIPFSFYNHEYLYLY